MSATVMDGPQMHPATEAEVEAGIASWCADCSASCPYTAKDMLVVCSRFCEGETKGQS